MKHVTKIMIAGWNTGMFVSYRRPIEEKYFQQKRKYNTQ